MADLVEHLPPMDATQAPLLDSDDVLQNDLRAGSSSKIDQLIHLLQLTPSNEKCLVFSQFKKFLDKVHTEHTCRPFFVVLTLLLDC